MTINARSLALIAGLILAAVGAGYLASGRGAGGAIHLGGFAFQDVMFWIFGLGLVGTGLWRVARGVSIADWHVPFWFALGAAMIYAQVFDVLPMKEFACQVLLQGRGHHSSPCYKP